MEFHLWFVEKISISMENIKPGTARQAGQRLICRASKKSIQSNLRMWSPLLRDHLFQAATISGSLEPKYSANEPVLRGHLS